MLAKQKVLTILERVLAASKTEAAEVVLIESDSALTRFADNVIHQNVANHDVRLTVRLAQGNRIGVAGTNAIDPDAIRDVVTRATEIAAVVAETPDFPGLPNPVETQQIACFDDAVADCSPGARADLVKIAVDCAKANAAQAAGALATTASSIAVANSLGVRAFHAGTEASLNLTMTVGKTANKPGSSARTTQVGWKLSDLDVNSAAERVAERALAGRDPIDLEPGAYAVVLAPSAVATLVEMLSHLGFGAKAYQERRSFMTGKMGLKITGSDITIVDDGLDEAGIPFPFDFEGMPKRRVVLLEKGVAKGVVHDSRTAAVEGKTSTGHALPAKQAAYGPYAWNLFMSGGDSSLEEMIASTRHGLLVNDFHYVNIAEPMKTVLTGMTRFGTFLIEDGKLGSPVRDLRFTQSVLDAFERVAALSRDLTRFDGCVVPALKIDSFHFTGKTGC